MSCTALSSPTPGPRGQKEPSCSYWSTTTAGCSCTGAGSQKRTPGPARTCCARQFHAGGCPRSSMSIMGLLTPNHQLARACAVLGIALVHSQPYRPQGRGKQERLNSYIRSSFIAEAEDRGIASFAELNDLFMAWAEQVANARAHAETKQPPMERFLEGFRPDIPAPSTLAEAFRWSVTRRVTKTATISLLANRYQVPATAHRPGGRAALRPRRLGQGGRLRQRGPRGASHAFYYRPPRSPRRAPSRTRAPLEGPGVDYLGLVAAAHAEAVGEGSISYRHLPGIGPVTTRPPANGRCRHLGGALRFFPHAFYQIGARRQALRTFRPR